MIKGTFGRNSTNAAPLGLIGRDDLGVGTPLDPSPCTCPDQRSVWDILWSCLATIFACSWVSVHPNMPAPSDSRTKIALRRMELMFWAIVAPEMVIVWAMRQWVGARKLAERWKDRNWTKTHGYFIQMGGFMLYEGDEPKGVLSPEQLRELSGKGRIQFPTVTEKEIQDRSKADALSKGLVILQTVWFMLQCMARAIEGLEITQLELLTVGLAFLNAFMYFLWWNKPLDVQTPVSVYLLDEPLQEPLFDGVLKRTWRETGESTKITLIPPIPQSQATALSSYPSVASLSVNDEASSSFLPISVAAPHPSSHLGKEDLQTLFRGAARSIVHFVSSTLARIQQLPKEKECTYNNFIRGPTDMATPVFHRLRDMLGSNRSQLIDTDQMRVSTFYALFIARNDIVLLPACVIAVVFGAIHCAGWSLSFPSVPEAWLWRISSIAISITPLLWGLVAFLNFLETRAATGSLTKRFAEVLAYLLLFSGMVMLPVYVIARILLLVEAFVGLRTLTPGTLAVIKWTTVLPHI